MSYTNQVFQNKNQFFTHLESQLQSNGWTLEYVGDDNGDSSWDCKVYRSSDDRFSIGWRYTTQITGDAAEDVRNWFNIMIDYNQNESFMSQSSGANQLHWLSFLSNRNFVINLITSPTHFYLNVVQGGMVKNMYVGSINAYKPSSLNNEDLMIASSENGFAKSYTVPRSERGNEINFNAENSIYSELAWRSVNFNTNDNTYELRLNNTSERNTFFPMVVFDTLNSKVLGELKDVYMIDDNVNLGYTFTYQTDNFVVVDSNSTNTYLLAIKTN